MATTFLANDVIGRWADADQQTPLIVLDSLQRYLTAAGIPGAITGVTPLGDGHSNITARLQLDDRTLVLRRPPRPPWQPSAHNVLREARILQALADTDVPVPVVHAACDDETVIGAPFYIMSEIEGSALTDDLPPPFEASRDGAAITRRLITGLASIHGVQVGAVGLDTLAPPDGYLHRQIKRFAELWTLNRTREVPEIDGVRDWLSNNTPRSHQTTLMHGDYRLGNTLFTADPVRLTAVLDWEMSTLGDPLADVGYLFALWAEPGDAPWMFDLSPVTRQPGFPTRSELMTWYSEASGREVTHLDFYVTLALWKSAIIMEGNYKRAISGEHHDDFLRGFADGVLELAHRANDFGPRQRTLH